MEREQLFNRPCFVADKTKYFTNGHDYLVNLVVNYSTISHYLRRNLFTVSINLMVYRINWTFYLSRKYLMFCYHYRLLFLKLVYQLYGDSEVDIFESNFQISKVK